MVAALMPTLLSPFSLSPNLQWGNQAPMWPISREALMAVPTPRLVELAEPKKDHRLPNILM